MDEINNKIGDRPIGSASSRNGGGTKKPGVVNSFLKGILIGGGVILLVLLVVLGIVAVKYGWKDSVKETVRETLDLPAAKVNGRAIPYSSFTSDLESARHFFSGAAQAGSAPSDEELRAGVLDRLIEQMVIEEESEKLNITVSQEEIDAEFQKLADAEGGDPAQQIDELYGWTIDEFKEKVMKYYVMETKLSDALANDPGTQAEVEAKANEVLGRLEAGEDFATVAADVSDDPGSAVNGGELGSFGRGVMVAPFEEAAFSLEPSERSGLVKTQFGYHIIEVTDNTVGDDGEVEEVEARHILIAFPSVQVFLAEKVGMAEVEKFIE